MAIQELETRDWERESSKWPLRGEYEQAQALFGYQPVITQHFFEAQGRQIANAILQNNSLVHFTLPEKVITENAEHTGLTSTLIPGEYREQVIGGAINRVTHADIHIALREHLAELECSNQHSVATSARIICYAAAQFIVYRMLPSGRTVQYIAAEGEEIPSIPVWSLLEVQSAIAEQTGVLVEMGEQKSNQCKPQVPFVSDACWFFLPQWVAFGLQGDLLVHSTGEAKSYISSMQRYLRMLHAAISLAPYFVVDSEYQKKRYGMEGQLVNQGRALACFQTVKIIQGIKHRAAAQDLNRGLSLSLPFFDDQTLETRKFDFTVIPSGRIMFAPAFVVRACREEQAKVAQDTRLSPSTRKYLIRQFKMLECAFQDNTPINSKK